jgi:hypothetical protein
MDAAVPLAFVALVAVAWWLAMRRFQLSRWTILVALAVLVVLLLLFFEAEGEDDPAASRGGSIAATSSIVRI